MLGPGGASASSHSVRSSARTTRTSVASDDPFPDSRYRTAESEAFDRSASSACVRLARWRSSLIDRPILASHSAVVPIR